MKTLKKLIFAPIMILIIICFANCTKPDEAKPVTPSNGNIAYQMALHSGWYNDYSDSTIVYINGNRITFEYDTLLQVRFLFIAHTGDSIVCITSQPMRGFHFQLCYANNYPTILTAGNPMPTAGTPTPIEGCDDSIPCDTISPPYKYIIRYKIK